MDPVSLSAGALAAIPMEKLAKDPNISEATKVGEMARQFEAVLLRQILASARKPVIEDEDDETSSTDKLYDDMINQQFADTISRSGDFGLARSLERELLRQTKMSKRDGSQETAAGPAGAAAAGPAKTPAAEAPAVDARAALTTISTLR